MLMRICVCAGLQQLQQRGACKLHRALGLAVVVAALHHCSSRCSVSRSVALEGNTQGARQRRAPA
eukprot:1109820-Pelagomonas_calceolata.AAC.1